MKKFTSKKAIWVKKKKALMKCGGGNFVSKGSGGQLPYKKGKQRSPKGRFRVCF